MPRFVAIKSRIRHFFLEIDEYSIHSPFLYDLYGRCFKKISRQDHQAFIEELRHEALKDPTEINTGKFGAASKSGLNVKSIKKIARNGNTPSRYSKLFMRLIRYFDTRNMLELGTSLGLNTLYLAAAGSDRQVFSFEGNTELSTRARKNFERARASNIRLIEGNIDDTLPAFLSEGIRPGFVYIDANHRFDPVIKYFQMLKYSRAEPAVFVLDDIHWSDEMDAAWNRIRIDPEVRADLDIGPMGIIIFKAGLPKISACLAF